MRRRPGDFAAGVGLRALLGRLGIRGDRIVVPPAPAGERAAEAPRQPSVRRRPLLVFMLGCLGVGMPLMLIFEHWATRVVGVVALFAFIVSGVFLIADPAFLAADDEDG